MATASQDGALSGGTLRVRSLFSDWWQHRASFLISLGITLAAVARQGQSALDLGNMGSALRYGYTARRLLIFPRVSKG
jgi:hypothetical protein